jgi:sulfoxide reductase catalytic subunit YedY
MVKIRSSEITPQNRYLTRRQFMKIGLVGIGASALAACGVTESNSNNNRTIMETEVPRTTVVATATGMMVDELGDSLTSFKGITNYNNYYEFSLDKQEVAKKAKSFVTQPWTVEVGGLVNKPKTYGIDDLQSKFTQEERIYRLRCVEAWSMVIPWLGFPLSKILNEVEPTSEAKYVRFETLYDPEQMPGQNSSWFKWPYVEGLRLDEAMHDLAILSTGIYGEQLLPQNGAPIRLVVPWKYGFKSIKSIVKIDLVSEMPVSLWMNSAPNEYGFYANVNPNVDHPRWSQRSERRIGEGGRRETLIFNGYEDEVANLYTDVDLSVFY